MNPSNAPPRESRFRKPLALQKGDRVATVSLSWGGPGAIPERYRQGKEEIQRGFGLEVIEMPNTLRDPKWIAQNPQARADDLMLAFEDKSIKAVISTIGGDDSIRLIPYIDRNLIRDNPKIFLGYSDTTVTHFACFSVGLVSFYGPSVMTGFAENGGMFEYARQSLSQLLFSAEVPGIISPNICGWTNEFLEWSDPNNRDLRRQLKPMTGWLFLQGQGVTSGRLIGGCMEVLDWLRGTDLWPSKEVWEGSILFLETSEEAPSPRYVTRFLRTLAAFGILSRLSGILFGRPGGEIDPLRFAEYDNAIRGVVCDENGLASLPIVTQMDFGHTDPMMTLPLGVHAEIDCNEKTFSILESATVQP
jgi:muramoyltetrapeptide carboxypeptidase LdcA involved in peptidoglycan recycling